MNALDHGLDWRGGGGWRLLIRTRRAGGAIKRGIGGEGQLGGGRHPCWTGEGKGLEGLGVLGDVVVVEVVMLRV